MATSLGASASATPAAATTPTTTPFTIPAVFDASFFNTPDPQSILIHAVSSSSNEEGFQAILCLHQKPHLPAHLGIPSLGNYEDKAFLQVSPESSSFILQSHSPLSHSMQVTVTEYLILLQFASQDWPRLKSKLNSQLVTMREGTDPIFMSGHLMFYNHGSSHFKVSISSRLLFRACIESRDPNQRIKTWLEKRPLSDASPEENQEMALPMNALTMLSQDTQGIKTLVDQMTAYKNRSRKRSKPVLQ